MRGAAIAALRSACRRLAAPYCCLLSGGSLHARISAWFVAADHPHCRHRADCQGHQDRAAAACLGARAPRPLPCDADAGVVDRGAVRRPRRLQARAQGNPAGRAQPGLHHQGQHAAAGRWRAVLPGHGPDEGIVWIEQFRGRDHAAVADHAALGDRQAGTRQDLRGARVHQPQRGQRAG